MSTAHEFWRYHSTVPWLWGLGSTLLIKLSYPKMYYFLNSQIYISMEIVLWLCNRILESFGFSKIFCTFFSLKSHIDSLFILSCKERIIEIYQLPRGISKSPTMIQSFPSSICGINFFLYKYFLSLLLGTYKYMFVRVFWIIPIMVIMSLYSFAPLLERCRSRAV